jgi:N-methylhydantoinase A
MVAGLNEEVAPDGTIVTQALEAEALELAQELIDRGARCLVVALANSDANPANERLVRDAIKREYPRDFLGSVPVFLSSNISQRSGERERVNAAVISGYIHSKLARLLYKAGEDLRKRLYQKSLFIGHNNGAVARVAKTRAINTYNSGPTGGLMGAKVIADLYGLSSVISADMGGTSFDLGYVHNGQPSYSVRPIVEGFPVNLPMLSIRAMGAGGGSIAHIENGRLEVGPQSAGALPGPVAFDLGGTEPTVTDADIVLGIIDPDYFLGGHMKLRADKARNAIEEKLARPLGVSVEEAALLVKETVDTNMGAETKRLKQEVASEADPVLLVFGGAGPAHCCRVAEVAGIKKILITPVSSVFSAFGASTMDVGHIYYRRAELPLSKENGLQALLTSAVADMRAEAERDLRGEGFALNDADVSLELFVKPQAGDTEVKVAASADFFTNEEGIQKVAQRAHAALAVLGVADAEPLAVTTVSLTCSAPVPHYRIPSSELGSSSPDQARKSSRSVILGRSGPTEVPVFDIALMAAGNVVVGPAVIESADTTALVPGGWRLAVDVYRNAMLEEV